ncbi:MAG: DUF4097 family beta strand repeat-containing protein [Lachnospiraceae bacterium]|nr:DUF4097 family beta strand repeat-containing protein [Lachnospiraceae bacterium]
MKTFTKTILILCTLFLTLGIIFCAAGWSMGYYPGTYLRQYQQQIEDGTIELEHTEEFKNIQSLSLSVGMADCKIESYKGSKIRVESSDNNYVECETDGNTLNIQYGQRISGISWLIQNEPGAIRIYIPEKLHLKKLSIEGGAGQIAAEGLSCDELSLIGGAGAFSYQGSVEQNVVVGCGFGQVQLRLEGKAKDFEYSLDCGLGSVKVENGPSINMIGEYDTHGKADKHMELQCGLGSISVGFENKI